MSKNKPTLKDIITVQPMTIPNFLLFEYSYSFTTSEKDQENEIRKEKSAKKKERISERRKAREEDKS